MREGGGGSEAGKEGTGGGDQVQNEAIRPDPQDRERQTASDPLQGFCWENKSVMNPDRSLGAQFSSDAKGWWVLVRW